MKMRNDLCIEKNFNSEQHSCVKPYSVNKKSETKVSNTIKEFLKRTWAFRSKVTVEPFLVCYLLPSMLAGLAVQKLCFEKSCLVNLQYDREICLHIMQGSTHNYTYEEKKVQERVTGMTAWSYPLQTSLPGILALFVGAWSDRTGNRKAFMVIPILGKLVSTFGMLLSTFFFLQVGTDETALLEGLPPALAGGRVVMTMAVYSYITDITSVSERTYRLGIITAVMTLTRPIGMALSGVLTTILGYYGIFTMACVFYMIGFVYIILRLKEKTEKKNIDSGDASILDAFTLKDVAATLKVAFKTREGSKRLKFLLIMLAYMLIVGPVLGEAQMTYWFTKYKFKFTDIDYSLFLTYLVVVGSIGSFITIYLFSKKCKMEDSVIGMIACMSKIVASLVYAFAPTRSVYFVGPFLDMFSSAGATSLRSIATKLVDTDEIGKASSLISISEALIPIIYSPVYSKVYMTTLSTFSGAFYLISMALATAAMFIFIILYILQKSAESGTNKETIETGREVTRF